MWIGHSDSKIVDNVVDIEFSERTKLGFEEWVLEGLQNLRYDMRHCFVGIAWVL